MSDTIFFPISDNMTSMADDVALRAREEEQAVLLYTAAEGEGKKEEMGCFTLF